MDNELIGDDYSLEEKKIAEKLARDTDNIILTSLWQILFKGIDELKITSEPITSLEMLLIRACHMSIMPSPDAIIKNVLDNGSDRLMRVYNLERKSSLKTQKKDEIIEETELKTEDLEAYGSNESLDNSAVKEILDIFPGATVKK
jgi:DNA polymerase-3 subunit gamma/tau